MKESLRILTADGTTLAATRFIPASPNGKVVLINSATGVKQKYYHDFSAYLSNEGFYVYTYDYRGIGLSRPKRLRNFEASLHDWGRKDYEGMLTNIFQSHPQHHFIVIGHSVGGQLVGFSTLSSKVDAVVMVGAQTPFWKNFGGLRMRLKLFIFWFVTIPFFTRIAGYFPASKLGLFEDLPADVAEQWARWAKTENYAFDELPEIEQKFTALKQRSLMISFTDDTLAPRVAVLDLMNRYQRLKWQHWHLNPADVMQKDIGHFGFFKKRMQETLWKETLEWVNNPHESKESRAA